TGAPGARRVATCASPPRGQANRSEYAFSSAGLGWSICQQLVQAMGGELKVETALGKGTRFSFVLDLPISPRVSGSGERPVGRLGRGPIGSAHVRRDTQPTRGGRNASVARGSRSPRRESGPRC